MDLCYNWSTYQTISMATGNVDNLVRKVTNNDPKEIVSAEELHGIAESEDEMNALVKKMKNAEQNVQKLLKQRAKEVMNNETSKERKDKLAILDKKLEELDSDTKTDATGAVAGAAVAKGVETFADTATKGLDKALEIYEKFTTFLSYHLAPVLEKLQGIKGLGMESTIESALGFLGLEKTILFKSVRKAGLIPEFEKNSKLDNEAITAMIAKSKEVMAANPQTSYGPQKFFEAATQQYAAKHAGQKNFKLADLAAFATSQEFLNSQSAEAKKMPVAAPAAAPAAPAGSPAAAEVVKLSPLAAGVLTAEFAGKKHSLKCEHGKVTVDGTKTWKLVAPQTGLLSLVASNVAVEIQELKPTADGLLSIKTKSPKGIKEGTLPQETIQKLLKHIADGTTYDFSFEGTNLSFMIA